MNIIDKAFKCVEALAGRAEGLTVTETATLAGLSRPATDRLLESLREQGIVYRDKTKRYRLGPRLYQWSNVAMQAGTPINLARRELVSMCMDLGSECNFLVLSDLETVIVERCDLIDSVPVNRPVQVAPRPWYETGTGRAIVAFYSPDERQDVMERTYRGAGPTLPPRDELEAELDAARTRGYVLSPDRRNANQMGAVLPVFEGSGYAVAALGSYMKREEAETEAGMAFIARMAVASGRISHYLGYEEEG